MGVFDYKRLKVAVGIPTRGMWVDKFGMSLLGLLTYFHNNPVVGYKKQEIHVLNIRGSILPNQRVDIFKKALEIEATHVLFLDDDQVFPAQTLHRMLSHKKEIVAANIAVKQYPSNPTARAFNPNDPARGTPVFTDEGSTGLEEVWRVGTGIMLIDIRVIQRTGLNVFNMAWQEEHQKYRGEDWDFCEAFQKHGYSVFVDHDLSARVGHVGPFEYTHDFVGVLKNG